MRSTPTLFWRVHLIAALRKVSQFPGDCRPLTLSVAILVLFTVLGGGRGGACRGRVRLLVREEEGCHCRGFLRGRGRWVAVGAATLHVDEGAFGA